MDRVYTYTYAYAYAYRYRKHSLSQAVEQTFLARGIPYILSGGRLPLVQRRAVKDGLAYLRLLLNTEDEQVSIFYILIYSRIHIQSYMHTLITPTYTPIYMNTNRRYVG